MQKNQLTKFIQYMINVYNQFCELSYPDKNDIYNKSTIISCGKRPNVKF